MNYLKTLAPAQVLLLRDGKHVHYLSLLRYTLMDLVARQVLSSIEVETPSKPNETRVYPYIIRGEKFHTYKPKIFEKVFLRLFESNDVKVLLKHLVQTGFENSENRRSYIKLIRNSSEMNDLFDTGFWAWLSKGQQLTRRGENVKQSISTELLNSEQSLNKLLKDNHAQAMALATSLRGNLFLIPNIDLSTITDLDKLLREDLSKYQYPTKKNSSCGSWMPTVAGCGGSGCSSGCGSDSGCSSSHSGCGGDSGCGSSGCSGCGGCGGGGD